MNARWRRLAPLSLLLIPLVYLATLARGLVLGDPTEYTLVANVLGTGADMIATRDMPLA